MHETFLGTNHLRRGLLACIALIAWALSAQSPAQNLSEDELAQGARPCEFSKSRKVWFSNSETKDTLAVSVKGSPCSNAKVEISVVSADGSPLYEYSGDFILHMPYIIHEPELNKLVEFFVEKVLSEALRRTTNDLPTYTSVEQFYDATNDFVVIPLEQYRRIRQFDQPILWHATGDSTWVHVVYDPQQQQGQVIMRGGVFQ